MEDNNTRFTPSFPGVPACRLPFRSVYTPVVPCVLDGSLSLLELIAKMQYIINQHQAGIEANHTDIDNLAAELEQTVTDLTAYINSQDAATLAAAKSYAEDLRDLLKAYVDTQDGVTLNAAKAYADALDTAVRVYIAAQLALKQDLLTFDSAPTDGSSNPVTSDGIYDALTLKQDVLTFDSAPTEDSSNPVTSDGIKAALDAAYGRMPQCAPLIIDTDAMTVSTVGVLSFDTLYAKMHTLHSFYMLEITDTATTSAMREAHAFAYPETYSASIIHWTLNDATPNNETLRISVTSSNVWTVTIV
ncbi:MAG: hypothetical protein J6V38_02785 [Kiritimatiellae bacterium]|nr:hypothetical protein [Kiritimatiellia bacterium]